MKILIASDNYYPNVNGASYFAQRYVKLLIKSGHEVLVITPSRTFRDEQYQHNGAIVLGIKSFPLERIRVPIPFSGNHLIKTAFQTFKPDIVHIQSHFAVGRKVQNEAQKLGIPVVGTNHFMPENLTHYLPIGRQLRVWLNHLLWVHFRVVFNKLDAVTAPTQSAAKLLQQSGFSKPVEVISNGIDLKFFQIQATDEIKAKYNFSHNPSLLFVGRIDKEKNLDAVIKALTLTDNNFHLVIAGHGAEVGNLKKMAERLRVADRVSFLGFVPDEDLPGVLASTNGFVIAGNAELQSIATLEAMAAGLPVIAVNAVALPELVHHGENGYLFEHGNISQLSGHMRELFSDESRRKQMGEQSRRIAAAHDINQVLREFLDLYTKIL